MRVPSRLGRLAAGLVCSFALLVEFPTFVPESWAGPAPGLCHMNTARGVIPASFAIQACTDTRYVYLHNNLTVALTVKVSGDVGPVKRTESDYGLAADATRLHSSDPWIILPGDTLRIPVGARGASFRLYDSRSAGFYALAETVQTFVPGTGPAVIGAFTGLISELNDDFSQYKDCLIGRNWIAQLGCRVLFTRNVSFAFARATVTALATGALSAVLAGATFTKWLGAQVPAVEAVLGSGTIQIAPTQAVAVTPAAPPTATAPTAPATSGFAIGSRFDDDCVIAWPTAPVYTSNSIEMTMSCEHVPEDEYLFTNVTYDNTGFQPTPDSGTIHVVGQVVNVARSAYGFSELVVQASSVTIVGNSG